MFDKILNTPIKFREKNWWYSPVLVLVYLRKTELGTDVLLMPGHFLKVFKP